MSARCVNFNCKDKRRTVSTEARSGI